MPEQMAFARKASGLVRGLSFVDAFGVGFMNQGLTPSMWVMISFGLGVYTGGNLIWATVISAFLCGIGFSLVWGILGGSMPRSGGEYIYNSRILHPIVGIAESFGNAFVWIMWIFVLAPFTVDPGLVMMFQFLNMPGAAEWVQQDIAFFMVATLVNLIGMLFVVFGVKVFARVQKVIMVLAILGTMIILLVFSFTSNSKFVARWDSLAAKQTSVAVDLAGVTDYADFTAEDAEEGIVEYLTIQLLDRVPTEDILNPQDQSVIVPAGTAIAEDAITTIAGLRTEEELLITEVAVEPLTHDAFLSTAKAVIEKVDGNPLPKKSNFFDTLGLMVAGSWLFAYAYCITFIAGEVKRPDKTIILANLAAVLVPAAFMIWLAIVLYNTVGFQFLSATAWVDNMEIGFGGLPFIWSTHFVGLMAVINQNSIVVFLAALSYILFTLWWVALSYLAFPRILFAWGMDRMGPKWFADIDFRWASPVKNHILCFILAEIGILVYALGLDPMAGLSVTGLEIVSVFGVTAIAAAVFPFSKKAKAIWESSPYRKWNILGIPVVTIGAVVNLIYLGILFYFFFFMAEMGEQELVVGSAILYAIIWGLGIIWYFYWKARNKKIGVDTNMTFGELPPD